MRFNIFFVFVYLILQVRTSRNTFQEEHGVSSLLIIILNVSLNVLNVSLNIFCTLLYLLSRISPVSENSCRLSDLPIIILANLASLVLSILKSFSN